MGLAEGVVLAEVDEAVDRVVEDEDDDCKVFCVGAARVVVVRAVADDMELTLDEVDDAPAVTVLVVADEDTARAVEPDEVLAVTDGVEADEVVDLTELEGCAKSPTASSVVVAPVEADIALVAVALSLIVADSSTTGDVAVSSA